MDIVLGGFLENSMIRKHDRESTPDRNESDHPYYISLNRDTPSEIKSRCDTLLTITDIVSIPSVDWNPAYDSSGPLSFVKAHDSDHQTDVKFLADTLVSNRAFSPKTYNIISDVNVSSAQGVSGSRSAQSLRKGAAIMYVERLILQTHLAREHGRVLALTDVDIQVLSELRDFLLLHKLPTPFDIPDVDAKRIINGGAMGVISSFSAIDMRQISVARSDKKIREYSKEIQNILLDTDANSTEADLIRAMRNARSNTKFLERFQTGFEIFSWTTKPLSYIPIISNGITLANDSISLFRKWLDRNSNHTNWHLLGARLEEIRIDDYLSRKDNIGR